MADQKVEERMRKKEEIKKNSATKPKRLSKYQYPTLYVECPSLGDRNGEKISSHNLVLQVKCYVYMQIKCLKQKIIQGVN